MQISIETIKEIVCYGGMAPSGDNLQPWHFVWHPKQSLIQLFFVPGRGNSFFDVNNYAPYVALGAVIENIAIAASHFGLEPEINYFPERENNLLIANIYLSWTKGERDPLYEYIPKRCVNRKPYYKYWPVPIYVKEALRREVARFPGVKLHWVDDSKLIFRLAKLVWKADWIRFEMQSLHEDLHKKLRFTKEEKEQTRDGLAVDTLEVGKLGEWFLKFTRPWSRMQALNRLGMSKIASLQTFLLMYSAPIACLVTTERSENTDFLTGGRAIQRIFLRATKHRLAIQPITVLTLFILRLLKRNGEGFSPQHLSLIRQLYADFKEIFSQNSFSEAGGLIMLFRLGYAPPPTSSALRRKVEDILTIKRD